MLVLYSYNALIAIILHQHDAQTDRKVELSADKLILIDNGHGVPVPEFTCQVHNNSRHHHLHNETIHKERVGNPIHEETHAHQIIHSADEQLRLSVAPGKGYAVAKGHSGESFNPDTYPYKYQACGIKLV